MTCEAGKKPSGQKAERQEQQGRQQPDCRQADHGAGWKNYWPEKVQQDKGEKGEDWEEVQVQVQVQVRWIV